jgi:hypothetical protein
MNLELSIDQGTCRIYTVSGSGYLGWCQSSVIFTLVTQQINEWFEYLKERGVEFEKSHLP